MGRHFGARMKPGVPPPPGSPAAQELGCTCSLELNAALPDNADAWVRASCPLHGWDLMEGSGNRQVIPDGGEIQTCAELVEELVRAGRHHLRSDTLEHRIRLEAAVREADAWLLPDGGLSPEAE